MSANATSAVRPDMWAPPLQTLHRGLAIRVLVGLFLVPFSLGMMFLGWKLKDDRHSGSGPGVGFIIFGLLMLALSVWLFYRESSRLVTIHPEGIKLKKGSQYTAIAWEAVDEIWLHAVNVQAGGLIGLAITAAVRAMSNDPFNLDKASQVNVKLVGGGQTLKFNKADKGCVLAFRFACERVNPRLLDRYARLVRDGGVAVFNKVALSLHGVSFNGKPPLAFAEIESLQVDGGFIRAKKAGKWLSAGSAAAAQTPNVMVLITLFDTLSGKPMVRTEGDLVGGQYV
ncbi:MAG: hypothetical protein IT370_10990 [Deltaproteobacteria bacterium]|nr:hypothetical protein [Deltaproteobacteria bacterium]